MRKQFIVQKYVMADSAVDAIEKAKRLPVHEVFVHNAWFDKQNNSFFETPPPQPPGFKAESTEPPAIVKVRKRRRA